MPLQISNEQDYTNHALKMERYLWSDGWSAAQISQIVDVVPGETYEFRAMAKGGLWGDKGPQGSIRLYDLQDANNTEIITVTSDDFKEYTGRIDAGAKTKQIKVEFYLEKAKWGSRPSSLIVDDAVLEGRSRVYDRKVGFSHSAADVDYFTYDDSGAFAPLAPTFGLSVDSLRITGTGEKAVFTVQAENLTNDITFSVPTGFSVNPTVIKADAGTKDVEVTLLSTLSSTKEIWCFAVAICVIVFV